MKSGTMRTVALVLTLLCMSAVACLPPAAQPPFAPATPSEIRPANETPSTVQPEKEELPAYPLTIIDDTGRKVPIQKLPQRIVSLAPSNTEILFALGLDDKIVGTTDYCDYPQAAKTKPRVAGYSNPNIEKLLSLEPDLVVAESIHERMVLPALERLGLTVVVTRATSLEVVLHDIELLGQITGRSKAATQIVTSMKARIDAIVSKTSTLTPEQRPRVLYVCWHAPIWTMGSETFIDDLIWKAGGMNVFAADFKQSRAVSLEAVVTKNPEVIIVSGMGTAGDLIYNAILREERLKDVDAIISHRVYKMSDASLIERPGPRIVDGLEEVAKYIHPEIFGKGQASQR